LVTAVIVPRGSRTPLLLVLLFGGLLFILEVKYDVGTEGNDGGKWLAADRRQTNWQGTKCNDNGG